MTPDTVIEDDRWHDLDRLAASAVPATLRDAGLDPDACEVVVMGCDDARIAALNAQFRGKPVPTNVLSWPSEERGAATPGGDPVPPADLALGDVAIAYETCAREAAAQGKAFDAHVTHLLVHATLHLLGFDHRTQPDARRMEGAEVRILAALGLPDPYADDILTPADL